MHFVIVVVVESSALRSFPCYLHLRLIEPEMHFLCMCGCEGSEERAEQCRAQEWKRGSC